METTMTNEQRSAAEVAAFVADEPGPYFAYWKRADAGPRDQWPTSYPYGRAHRDGLLPGDTITTWMGDTLATVTHVNDGYTSNMGDVRQSFRAAGINGATYSGTAYVSAGDYVRMRPVKR